MKSIFNIKSHSKKFSVFIITAILVSATMVPATSYAGRVDEPPTPLNMVGDVMTRPVMIGATVVGTGLFLGTLPFSIMGGNAGQVGDVLVLKPFQAAFLRCLGCTNANADSFGGTRPVE